MRYSDKDGSIKFDDFVACVVRLNTLFGECSICVFYYCKLESHIFHDRILVMTSNENEVQRKLKRSIKSDILNNISNCDDTYDTDENML